MYIVFKPPAFVFCMLNTCGKTLPFFVFLIFHFYFCFSFIDFVTFMLRFFFIFPDCFSFFSPFWLPFFLPGFGIRFKYMCNSNPRVVRFISYYSFITPFLFYRNDFRILQKPKRVDTRSDRASETKHKRVQRRKKNARNCYRRW